MKEVTKYMCEFCIREHDSYYLPIKCTHCGKEACRSCIYDFESPNRGHMFYLTLHTKCLIEMAKDQNGNKFNYTVGITKK